MKRLGLFCCLMFFVQTLLAQGRMSSAEISYLYNQEHDFIIQQRVASEGNKVKAYVRFILNSGSVKISDFRLSYDLRSSYIDEKQVNSSVAIDSSHVIDIDFRQYVYAFEFEKGESDKLLVIDVYNIARDQHYSLDIPLVINDWTPPPYLIFESDKEVPYFASYLNKDYPVRVLNAFGSDASYQIRGIENNKAVAMPPFNETNPEAPSEVALDTLYGVNESEVFRFYNEGFYTLQTADYPGQSLSILVTDEFHPYFSHYQDLASPLIYVSTVNEYKAMQTGAEPRTDFEFFVTNTISSNTQVAKDFIKYYYRRIRKSARLFSEDKEGWKTDRGMIYQVFGDPLQVFRNEKTELWVYASSSGGRTRFIFDIVIEEGMIKHKLIRGKRYREAWMLAVTQWRSGRIIE